MSYDLEIWIFESQYSTESIAGQRDRKKVGNKKKYRTVISQDAGKVWTESLGTGMLSIPVKAKGGNPFWVRTAHFVVLSWDAWQGFC